MAHFQRQLYTHIRSMLGDHDEADDVLQNTFIKAWRFIDNFRGDASLKTWLWRIATNETLTIIAKRKRRSEQDLKAVENSLQHSEQSAGALDSAALQQRLEAAVASLPDKQRQVFVMKYYDDLKYSEIVEIIGGTEGSHKASFHHAVKKIENFLLAG
jgi:RNA polymerase sigma factor (sigma-70 family)